MTNQFSNIPCYEEVEIQSVLSGISKSDVLKEFGCKVSDYYFFVSNDGVFNWFDLKGNHIKDPGVLKRFYKKYIPKTITKCIIPDSVISIDNEAFSYCTSLTSITIPKNVTSIGEEAFWSCRSLKEMIIPNTVTSIGRSAFSHCYLLKEITIPNSITSIGMFAFFYCNSLTTISIPNSITNIGACAFVYCDSLKEVIFKGKTLEEVKQMKNYPFGIEDENAFKCEIC